MASDGVTAAVPTVPSLMTTNTIIATRDMRETANVSLDGLVSISLGFMRFMYQSE